MRSVFALSRSVDQLTFSQAPRQICRSCRLQVAAPRRQIQTSACLRSEAGVSDKTSALSTSGTRRVGKFPTKPEDDPDYVESLTWDDLQHVGSPKWVEGQYDPLDEYTGWTKVARSRQYEDAQVDELLRQTANEVLSAKGESVSTGDEWLSHRLSDQRTKFALVKSLREKTGLWISDFQWSNAKSINDFRNILLTKPQPKKLAQQLIQRQTPIDLPNVKISSRRVTPIDKEKALGRWKIIEQELQERGLPVTGHRR